MVENFLVTQNFYFSYSYDLTLSLQKLQETSPEFLALPLYERVNFFIILKLSQHKVLLTNYRLISAICGIII